MTTTASARDNFVPPVCPDGILNETATVRWFPTTSRYSIHLAGTGNHRREAPTPTMVPCVLKSKHALAHTQTQTPGMLWKSVPFRALQLFHRLSHPCCLLLLLRCAAWVAVMDALDTSRLVRKSRRGVYKLFIRFFNKTYLHTKLTGVRLCSYT